MKPKIFLLLLLSVGGMLAIWSWQRDSQAAASPARVVVEKAEQQPLPLPVATQTQAPADPVQQFAEQLLTPPYSQAVTAANLAQTEAPVAAAVTVPLDGGIVWSLQLEQYRFSYPQPIKATIRVQGEQPSLVRYQLRSTATVPTQLLSSGEVAAAPDGLFRLELPGQTDFPSELELSVESEPGHGALARLSYSQPVAWLEHTGVLEADDSDLVLPLQLQVHKAGLYRVQAVLGLQQKPAKPLAILQGEFVLPSGSQPIRLRAHHSVLPVERFDAELSRLQLELAPAVPGATTGYGRPLAVPVALGDFDPAALNRTPYQPDAQALQSAALLQQISR